MKNAGRETGAAGHDDAGNVVVFRGVSLPLRAEGSDAREVFVAGQIE